MSPRSAKNVINFLVFVASCCLQTAVCRRPHIIFILSDDLGWNDVGFHGMTDIPTPNIDALASDGIVLNNYYTQALCTPSRAALMTGYYPMHLGLQHLVIINGEPRGLSLSYTILPQWLNKLGYVSKMVGKWHLGFFRPEYLPTNRGFESHYGFWAGFLDYFNFSSTSNGKETEWAMGNIPKNIKERPVTLDGYDFRDDMRVVKHLRGQYLTDVLTNRAVEIINNHNASQPLFLYLAHHAPHRGILTKKVTSHPRYSSRFRYIADDTRRGFAGALTALDESVGYIVEALHERGMLENSIIVFSSDNGAGCVSPSITGGSNWPLRSEKITNWEGAVRNVGLVWSPLLKRTRRVSRQLMHISDWLPTLYTAAGGNSNDLGKIDGTDMWKSLSENVASPRTEILINIDSPHNNSALKRGGYKLIQGRNQYPMDLDDWYGPTGREPTPGGIKWGDVPVVRTLRKLHHDPGLQLETPKAEVKCGEKPANKHLECDLCLFDIENDPCEYRDISNQHPDIVAELWGRIQELNRTAVPPQNIPIDYKANPEFYNGMWSPWLEDTCDLTSHKCLHTCEKLNADDLDSLS